MKAHDQSPTAAAVDRSDAALFRRAFLAPADAVPLPLLPAKITASWLTAALRQRRTQITVQSAVIEDVILGTSTKIRVRLVCTGAGAREIPSTVIVKGGFEAHSPTLREMYANEVRFYADIQEHIPMPSPSSFFAGSDPDSHQSIVIMEDLRPLGVEFCHPLRPQNFDQVARRLETMAGYHAATWNSREFQPGGRWHDIGSRFEAWGLAFMRRYLAPETWAHYVASPRGAACSVELHDRFWMERVVEEFAALEAKRPCCMIHGDTHLGNLYIAADGMPGFFDAQVARAPWYLEVSYHIVCALDQATRPRWEAALLDRYLRALADNGVDAPSFDDAWLDYRRAIAYGLLVFLTNEVIFQTESVNTAYAARFSAACLQHRTKSLFG